MVSCNPRWDLPTMPCTFTRSPSRICSPTPSASSHITAGSSPVPSVSTSVTNGSPVLRRRRWGFRTWKKEVTGSLSFRSLTATRCTVMVFPRWSSQLATGSELLAQDLPGDRPRQGLTKFKIARDLEGSQTPPGKPQELMPRTGGPGSQDDIGLWGLPTRRIGNANHHRFGHGRMGRQHLLDLSRIHVETANDDQILLPVDNVEVSIVIAAAEISGAEPSVLQDLPGGVRPVEIPQHDVRTPGDDLSHRSIGDLSPLLIDHLELDARKSFSH